MLFGFSWVACFPQRPLGAVPLSCAVTTRGKWKDVQDVAAPEKEKTSESANIFFITCKPDHVGRHAARKMLQRSRGDRKIKFKPEKPPRFSRSDGRLRTYRCNWNRWVIGASFKYWIVFSSSLNVALCCCDGVWVLAVSLLDVIL